MPFRTRNFLFFLVTVAFLVIAICVTVIKDIYPTSNNTTATVINAVEKSTEEVIYTAILEDKPALDRAGHIATLRRKIASFTGLAVKPAVVATTEVIDTPTKPKEEVNTIVSELKCPAYKNFTGNWSPVGLKFSIVEGARLVYREVEVKTEVALGSTTSAFELVKEVLLQLPLQTYPAIDKSCLPSDVVGVALDGSLIRNGEQKLYSVFGSETLVGYALDGFPIYGKSDLKTDECGGVVAGGQYHYYLSPVREAVLFCFAGAPVEI